MSIILAEANAQQAVIDLSQRRHPAHDQVDAISRRTFGRGACVIAKHTRDHLQIVTDPM
jgi:hypothetical protein